MDLCRRASSRIVTAHSSQQRRRPKTWVSASAIPAREKQIQKQLEAKLHEAFPGEVFDMDWHRDGTLYIKSHREVIGAELRDAIDEFDRRTDTPIAFLL